MIFIETCRDGDVLVRSDHQGIVPAKATVDKARVVVDVVVGGKDHPTYVFICHVLSQTPDSPIELTLAENWGYLKSSRQY